MINNLILETPQGFSDFELLDSGASERLERWGGVIIRRPDPQAIWPRRCGSEVWGKASAVFDPAGKGERGAWKFLKSLPQPWTVEFSGAKFLLKPSPFKHTGLFAEQAANWAWMVEKLKSTRSTGSGQNSRPKILNLFAYTGGATVILAKAGCLVTHVDASKPAITWANENHKFNSLPQDSVRWMLDDAVKFVKREVRRGAKYDGILMDPPAFGHGPTGKVWKFNEHLPDLLSDCVSLLSSNARFLLVNGYATNSSALALGNLLEAAVVRRSGPVEAGELCLKDSSGRLVSTGIFARWRTS
ncbi:MAG: class I SAM-dependent methyltransferase [Patescibacteria group bacterium]|nr:class I SAM-dependent methyltransferase [Patescibacteria group bacterium]